MSDHNTFSQPYADALSKFVPGFDFLQGLVKNAGTAMPGIGQWVAPTLDPQEIERRISELRTVQFWLEQNARMIGTTIQALEVQRMTLGTLKSMNVSLGDLGEALKVRMPEVAPAVSAPAPAPAPAPAQKAAAPAADESAGDTAGVGGGIDPMQWWGALTQQFTHLASQAMKATSDATAEAAAQASQAMQASTTAAADAQARAADAVQEVIQTVTETVAESVAAVPVVPGMPAMPAAKKRATRKATAPAAETPKPATAPNARKSASRSAKG